MTARNDLIARIRYRSHRGMLELDWFLVHFAENELDALSMDELQQLANLLDEQDPDIHAWLMNDLPPPSDDIAKLLDKVRACR